MVQQPNSVIATEALDTAVKELALDTGVTYQEAFIMIMNAGKSLGETHYENLQNETNDEFSR